MSPAQDYLTLSIYLEQFYPRFVSFIFLTIAVHFINSIIMTVDSLNIVWYNYTRLIHLAAKFLCGLLYCHFY